MKVSFNPTTPQKMTLRKENSYLKTLTVKHGKTNYEVMDFVVFDPEKGEVIARFSKNSFVDNKIEAIGFSKSLIKKRKLDVTSKDAFLFAAKQHLWDQAALDVYIPITLLDNVRITVRREDFFNMYNNKLFSEKKEDEAKIKGYLDQVLFIIQHDGYTIDIGLKEKRVFFKDSYQAYINAFFDHHLEKLEVEKQRVAELIQKHNTDAALILDEEQSIVQHIYHNHLEPLFEINYEERIDYLTAHDLV